MVGLREFNKKINSLKNTRKITSSMKMISSVKLQKFIKTQHTAAPFCKASMAMLNQVASLAGKSNIFCNGYPEVNKSLIVLFSSDRGLCGRFNTNVIRKAMQLSETLSSRQCKCIFSFAGSKGHAFFKRRRTPVEKVYEGSSVPTYAYASGIADDLFNSFIKGDFQEIWIVYTRKVALQEEPCAERLLPFEINKDLTTVSEKVLLEENVTKLLVNFSRLAVRAQIYRALLESTVSEHTARMGAMDAATSNCDKMIQRYIKLRNRARQTAITTELTEIVSGKEAIDH
jgi:F-type H+-transporting ATPase subunit gamma